MTRLANPDSIASHEVVGEFTSVVYSLLQLIRQTSQHLEGAPEIRVLLKVADCLGARRDPDTGQLLDPTVPQN